MLDLRQLVADAERQLPTSTPPPFRDVQRAAARRRRRHLTAAVAGGATLGVAGVLSLPVWLPTSGNPPSDRSIHPTGAVVGAPSRLRAPSPTAAPGSSGEAASAGPSRSASTLPANGSTTPTSLGARAQPSTIAQAERIAVASALNPATATVAWARTLTVGQLRARGDTYLAGLPDATPMFVVAVDGDTVTEGSPVVKPRVVHKFTLVFNGSGTGSYAGGSECIGAYCYGP